MDAQYIAGTVLFAYIVWLIIRYYRAGNRREAASLLVICCIVFLATMSDLAVSEGLYLFVFTVEYAWLAVVIFVGLQRSRQLMEAAEARRALVESEKRYRGIFESLQDVYFRADSEGVIRRSSALRSGHSAMIRRFSSDATCRRSPPTNGPGRGLRPRSTRRGPSRTSSFP